MPRRLSFGSIMLLAALAVAPARAAGWQIDDTESPLDGARSYAAQINSTNTIHEPSGADLQATFLVRCKAGVLDAYIVWPQTLGPGPLDMRWRADANAPSVDVWSVSPGMTATFSENPRALLAALRTAHNVSFQLSLANFTSLQASFDVTGIAPIADTATAACRS